MRLRKRRKTTCIRLRPFRLRCRINDDVYFDLNDKVLQMALSFATHGWPNPGWYTLLNVKTLEGSTIVFDLKYDNETTS